MQQLGLIAGAGELPVIIAQQAYEDGKPFPTIALAADVAAQLTPYCPTIAQLAPGQLSKIIRTLQHFAVRQVVIVGKVSKRVLFTTPRVDFRAMRLLSRLSDYQDVTLLQAIVKELALAGIEVVDQPRVLGHLLTPSGVLGNRQPSLQQWRDIKRGFHLAKQLASLDIGQTVVIRHGTVLAVEALEGTDAAIQRGCALGHRGAVVVKVSRPQQDWRFDVPTVGPDTIQTLIAGQARVLAVEAEATFMIRQAALVATANAQGLVLVGVSQALLQQVGMKRGG